MDDTDFEGTIVLERLAAVAGIEAFSDAVEADDTVRATTLMQNAGIDAATIATVLGKMEE